ncbi:MAG: hypothetical protein JW912_00530, partial [Sedimentisphaerales bacterium]|nr:hypothetical protein [Sedimentisphaerales bacterium]
ALRIFFLFSVIFCVAVFAEGSFLGDESDGSRSNIVHRINLLSAEGDKIFPDDDLVLPFSTKQTCGACHDYEKISTGWHFNSMDKDSAPGRVSQPWILTDPTSMTQLPLSYRAWQGLQHPDKIGLTRWKFAKAFGSHTPGGILEDIDKEPDFDARWMESGELEINCLSCHDAESAHDQAVYAIQLDQENFRWAAAATSAFAQVKGSARSMPEMYDHLMPPQLDDPKLIAPEISYDKHRFDNKGKLIFDLNTDISNERCYFCHSSIDISDNGKEKWAHDEDVHIAAGLNCVDCHRNGVDHNITRGYEGEYEVSDNSLAALSSCRGCHLGTEGEEFSAGRLGAPKPIHAGIPVIHFESLSCTACHSGPLPAQNTILSKDACSHKLGTYGSNKSERAAPHIVYPVYARQDDGKIAPSKLIWPSFWGRMIANAVTPILPEKVKPVIGGFIDDYESIRQGDFPKLSEEKVAEILKELTSRLPGEGELVYIAGGTLYQLDADGGLKTSDNEAAKPYLWPVAHNVRPASQSLGSDSCRDCHSAKKPFLFGDVSIDSPVISKTKTAKMLDFTGLNKAYTRAFALSFVFRPMFKISVIGSSLVLMLVLLLYGLKALGFVVSFLSQEFANDKGERAQDEKKKENIFEDDLEDEEDAKDHIPDPTKRIFIIDAASAFFYVLTLVCFVSLLITGFVPKFVFGESLSGYMLMVHASCAPVFACSLTAAVLLWVHRYRFARTDLHPFKGCAIIPRICFWIILIVSIPLMLSIVLGMFPIFGTEGQHCLIYLHLLSAIILTVVAVIHSLLLIAAKLKHTDPLL